jgi:bifunctional non-homologous end joining protein LigD
MRLPAAARSGWLISPSIFWYFAGHDLRRCPIEHRKALLREILAETAGDRVVYVDHVLGRGVELFEKIRQLGAEGIVSKRLGRPYRGGESRTG